MAENNKQGRGPVAPQRRSPSPRDRAMAQLFNSPSARIQADMLEAAAAALAEGTAQPAPGGPAPKATTADSQGLPIAGERAPAAPPAKEAATQDPAPVPAPAYDPAQLKGTVAGVRGGLRLRVLHGSTEVARLEIMERTTKGESSRTFEVFKLLATSAGADPRELIRITGSVPKLRAALSDLRKKLPDGLAELVVPQINSSSPTSIKFLIPVEWPARNLGRSTVGRYGDAADRAKGTLAPKPKL